MKLNNYAISKNFSLWEFVDQNGMTFVMNDIEKVLNISALVHEIIQPLRDYINMPIEINSGYRTVLHNRLVGGKSNSQHLFGIAADLNCPDLKKAFIWIKENCLFDQLILEHNKKTGATWIHVSYKIVGKNRKMIINYLEK